MSPSRTVLTLIFGCLLGACHVASTNATDTDTAADPDTADSASSDSDLLDTDTSLTETDRTNPIDSDTGSGLVPMDADGDGHASLATGGDDCDDTRADVYPGAPEVCDGLDNDCNALIDDTPDPPIWWLDRDGDGAGDALTTFAACAAPPGYIAPSFKPDCNDLNPTIYPGAPEIPGDDIDQDCDGVDACFADFDMDGYGAPAALVRPGANAQCTAPGDARTEDDCDDQNPSVYPGAPEFCGEIDHDCNGKIGNLETNLLDALAFYRDHDGDTFGDAHTVAYACLQPTGFVTNALDCNDDLDSIHPNAPEICNFVDDNCNGLVDDADPAITGQTLWYADRDGDGYGNPDENLSSCLPHTPFNVTNGEDCDDTLAIRHPGAVETVGNTIDEDCDGYLSCFADLDGDGAAGTTVGFVPATQFATCNVPGFSSTVTDCVDNDPQITRFTYYRDADQDTWGDAHAVLLGCNLPSGYTTREGDCNDLDPSVHPGATEVAGDGKDGDCDGLELCFVDQDGDGYGTPATTSAPDVLCRSVGLSRFSNDCNDTDPAVSPIATEVIANGIDENCDGYEACYIDADADGAGRAVLTLSPSLTCAIAYVSARSDDCDDQNPAIGPLAPEVCNGIDDDCDGRIDDDDPKLTAAPVWFADLDGDGAGDPNRGVAACTQPEGRVAVAGDCDDRFADWQAECPWQSLALGQDFSCGVRTNGQTACVGGSAPTPPDVAFSALDASETALCGLQTADGSLWCAAPTGDPRADPPLESGFIALSVGFTSACAVHESGAVRCWGDAMSPVVTQAPVGWDFVAVDVAFDRACALTAAGELQCWGEEACDSPELAGASHVSIDAMGACVWDDQGTLACGGCVGSAADQAPSGPLVSVRGVWLREAACAVALNGRLSCWDGPATLRNVPTTLLTTRSFDIGPTHACAIDARGLVQCWGEASGLELPGPSEAGSPEP